METSHTALYRKYRPTSFADVRGQEPIVRALTGAIESGAIPHALLFAGSRGTGKTTVARLFAAAAGVQPIDTYEMDAASNRGIDDIRELKEAVHTLPYESPRKAYIIDEVHMLTKEAFNALLKTLEEPPAHVLFILATTEPERLLDTITSRCQVFTFRAPSHTLLRDTVLDVARAENFALAPAAADLIAHAADGSFRDALGLLQKTIMASTDAAADADEVAAIIGAPNTSLVNDVIRALHEGDTTLGLAAVETASEQNVDMQLFMRLVLERVRAVMLMRHNAERDMLEHVSEDERETIAQYARDAQSPINSALLLRLLAAAEHIGRTYVPQLPLEIAIIELTAPHEAAS